MASFYSAQLSVWFADIFELSNGGKPNVEITLEIIKLPVGITTSNLASVVLSSYSFEC